MKVVRGRGDQDILQLPPGCPNSVALTLLDNEGKMTSSTLSTSFLVAEVRLDSAKG